MHYAMDQMQTAYSTLIHREVATQSGFNSLLTKHLARDGKAHPRIVTLGGDHAIILPVLRSLHEVYGEIAVIHFDSHLDTWPVLGYYGINDESVITHGTMFWTAMTEGLIAKEHSIHAGIRCKMQVCALLIKYSCRNKCQHPGCSRYRARRERWFHYDYDG